jgi:CRP/FNR family transcriptional regulator
MKVKSVSTMSGVPNGESKNLGRLRVLRPANCFACQAREQSEWCALADDDLDVLDRAKTCNIYEPGQVIFYEGNTCLGIHCVEDGTVTLRKSDSQGGSVVVGMLGAGHTLGYLAYFSGGPYNVTAESLTSCRVCFVDKAAVRQILQRNPAVGMAFLRRFAEDLQSSEEERVRALTLPLRARLAHILLVLKDRSAEVDDRGQITIELPLSRRDLAAMLGARPESLSRMIRDFHDAGIARFGTREVIVPDLDLLIDQIEDEAHPGA